MKQTGIFEGRVQIPYPYGCFGYTRGGGKTWHGGIDLVGLDSDIIRMPFYKQADGTYKSISGTVTRSRIITDHSNLTWEWGYYTCVQLDANQTPDAVNFLYFCHNSKNMLQVGQKVKSGNALAIMGNTGNAALNDPPYKHCHFEVRATATGKGLDPTAYCGTLNTPGIYTVDTDKEDNMVQYMGMDCSKWQGDIDWAKVAKAGIKHVMIRAGYGRYSNQVDPYLQQNVEGCEANGIHYGFYWYSYATTTAQAKAEAQLFLATIKKYRPDMPLAYDIEYEKSILALTNAQRTAMVKTFLEEVEAAGYYGVLYASTNFIKSYLNYSQLTAYDVWAAQYASRCTCPLPYGMWQYTSSGKVDGVSGNVDLNLIYKNYPSIIKSAGLNGWPKTGNQPAGDGSGSWQDREPEGEQPESPVMQQPVITAVTAGDHEQFVALAKEIQVELTTTYNDTFAPLTQGDVDKVDALAKKLQLGSEHYSISQV